MLGRMNWSGLSNYTVQPSNMELFQTYIANNLKRSLLDKITTGVIKGGQLSVVSGLTVRIAAGSALMPNGTIVEWSQSDVTLSAANATNPRLDRIELSVVSTNNTNVIDEAGLTKVLDITQVPSFSFVTGTPAATPVLGSATVGSISLGYASVAANTLTLVNSNLIQDPYTGYDQSAYYLGSEYGQIRFNAYNSQYEVSNNGVDWMSIQTALIQNASAVIANGQVAPADVSGFILDRSKGNSYRFTVLITRETSTNKLRSYGHIDFVYNTNTSSWTFASNTIGDEGLSGVDLSVVLVSGNISKIQFVSTNVSGSGYVGTIKFSVKDIL